MAMDALIRAKQVLRMAPGVPSTSVIKILNGEDREPAKPITDGFISSLFEDKAEDETALRLSEEEYEEICGLSEENVVANEGSKAEKEGKEKILLGPSVMSINMVLVLPADFSAPDGQSGGLDDDMLEEQPHQKPKTKEELLAIAFNEVIPRDEPNKYRHLKPLYISAHVEGIPVTKVFVDCGATVNILPYSLMKKLDKSKGDLIPSDVVISSFVGDKSKTIRVLPLKITVADQTRVASFYAVESSVGYNILLGRNWIHVTSLTQI
jgi:hypothetical protein